MDNMIVINKLSFKYDYRVIFNNLCLSIKKGKFTTILGNNGCGKSTLVRLLTGLEDSNGSISIDGVILNNSSLSSIRRKIGVVFENPDNTLISETVMEDLAFPLENLNCSRDYIYSKINEISKYLGIDHLLNRCPRDLSGGEKQLVGLGCALITGPELIILDEAFSMVDSMSKLNMLKLLRRIKKDYNVTILNISHDIEESIYGDDIIVINEGKVVIHDSKKNVYREEKLLNKLGFELPFMVSLSNKLSYYDLLDKVVYDMEDMVDLLWK
ncbi:MAG: energy-coupling factor ABC transporter ATP-binding protein [Bacilli bacterium]